MENLLGGEVLGVSVILLVVLFVLLLINAIFRYTEGVSTILRSLTRLLFQALSYSIFIILLAGIKDSIRGFSWEVSGVVVSEIIEVLKFSGLILGALAEFAKLGRSIGRIYGEENIPTVFRLISKLSNSLNKATDKKIEKAFNKLDEK